MAIRIALFIINFLNRNKKLNQNIHILGAGSNTLFRDGGFDGTIVKLGNEFANIKILSDGNLEVGAACLDKKVANFALENSIKDFEFLSCIPGSIGGTIAMNSGCYEHEIANSIISVDFLTLSGELKTFKRDQINFYYRGSDFGETVIILSVKLKAIKGNKDEIQKKQNKFVEQKKISQPSKIKTCGSTFKNPGNKKAGLREA